MHTILCISSYFKGVEFMREAKALGHHVTLITSASLKHDKWPWESLDEVFYMSEVEPFKWNMDHLILGIAAYMRHRNIDTVVALDDFDVEKAAKVREIFRIPGMGQTTHRYFRDKLAMRSKAEAEGIQCPTFTSIFNNEIINTFIESVEAPWVLKPRSEASATGIKKFDNANDLWKCIHALGDERHNYLLEQFRPGDVYHVDSLVYKGEIHFACASRYLNPPLSVSHGGGVFMSTTLDPNEKETQDLLHFNNELLQKFGLQNGATHSEFIKDKETGNWYFLETASRVGGAYISNMVEHATGINLWKEWARIEFALLNEQEYILPDIQNHFAGLLIALSKEENPDLSFVNDVEFVEKIDKKYHIGLMFKSNSYDRIQALLQQYSTYVSENILNIIPPKSYATE
ncbi:MAG: ATPase [Flavobacteriaceae bacterium]|nr:ATPase [Flavobacteriaceae bacterium]